MTLINGEPDTRIDLGDRGLAYGHGVFEALLVAHGRLQLLDWHLERLRLGCDRLNIPLHRIESDVVQALGRLSGDDAAVKLIVTRGSGGRGYAVQDPELKPNWILQVSDLPVWPEEPATNGITLYPCQTKLAIQPLLAGIKHLNRLEQVLARGEWTDSRFREGLVCDQAGFVVEGTMSNLFWIESGTLHTPALEGAGVAGILRRWVIQIASSQGVSVEIGHFRPGCLAHAEEVFVCNSLIGLWPVVALEDWRWPVGEMTRFLQQQLDKEYRAC